MPSAGSAKNWDDLKITGATPIVDPFSAQSRASLGEVARIAHGVGLISRDGEAALVVLAINAADREAVKKGVNQIRRFPGRTSDRGRLPPT